MNNTTITAANNPRRITHIVIHCTATPHNTTIDSLLRYWRSPRPEAPKGWKYPGYHYIVRPNGEIVSLLAETLPSNGVGGHNAQSVHIAYIGGQFEDDRTVAQKEALLAAVIALKRKYPHALVLGHRDFPGVKKACPSFDAKTEYSQIR